MLNANIPHTIYYLVFFVFLKRVAQFIYFELDEPDDLESFSLSVRNVGFV